MEKIEHDIIIVGGGAAGLRAGIEAAETSKKLSVAIISKVYPMRSHTVSAEGGSAAVLRDYDSFDMHAWDTIKGSDFLADQNAVEYFIKEAPKEIIRLDHWGCPWSREADGTIASRAFGGMSVKRTIYASDKTGFHILHTLFQTSMKYENIIRYDEWFVTSLLIDDGKIRGVTAINVRTGEFNILKAKAVILATGGAGKVYEFTTNGNIKTGDGMAIAYNAGVALKDMEFVQFHPTGLPGTGILITEAARGEGGYLKNSEGERFLSRYVPGKMELGPRDMLSRAIITEISQNRGITDAYGQHVELDLTHLKEETINKKLPFVVELATKYADVDPIKEPIPVRPVLHYVMGGIHVNINGETNIHGLYAAGETACITINGANRLGSNSLTECLVFGAKVGKESANYCLDTELSNSTDDNQIAIKEEKRIYNGILKKESGKENIAEIRSQLRENMDTNVGIIRNEKSMKKACKTIGELKNRFKNITVQDKGSLFNTEFISALELDFMLNVAETMAYSALARCESRGSHYRSDYLKRDDEKFLKHTLAYYNGKVPRLEYIPVNITKWKPVERKY